jgi:hypothetical protein
MPAGITKALILTGPKALVEAEGQEFMRLVLYDQNGNPLNLVGGEQGAQGPQGVPGAVGPQGPQGPQGLQGSTGSPGAKGDIGSVGPQGPQGPKGDIGNTGVAGPKGDTGEPGQQGSTGLKGDTGPIGPAGIQGPQGPKGDTGLPGPQGNQGIEGPVGLIGPKGDTGVQGPQGIQGAAAPVIPVVTALPANPANGQEVYFLYEYTAPGVLWRFRYRADSASIFKWDFVDGGFVYSKVSAVHQANPTNNDYQDLNVVGPDIVVPLTGDYEFYTYAQMNANNASQGMVGTIIQKVGGAIMGPATQVPLPVSRTIFVIGGGPCNTYLTKGDTYRLKYWFETPPASVGNAGQRMFGLKPIRVQTN